MDDRETFLIRVPGDGRAFPAGVRVRFGATGDTDTVIRDPNGDLVVVASEVGYLGGTQPGLVLHLRQYLG